MMQTFRNYITIHSSNRHDLLFETTWLFRRTWFNKIVLNSLASLKWTSSMTHKTEKLWFSTIYSYHFSLCKCIVFVWLHQRTEIQKMIKDNRLNRDWVLSYSIFTSSFYKDVFRTLSRTQDGTFYENIYLTCFTEF